MDLVEDGDVMAMMGSNVIDRRHVNLVGRRPLVGCGLSVVIGWFAMIGIRRLLHFQDFAAWCLVVLGKVFAPMFPMGL